MNKKEKITTKIISKLIFFLFVISLFGFILPAQTFAESSFSDTYNNPNKNTNNTYKFKISDVVNSNLLTSVVGCTGVVNKVSTWMVKFIQSPTKQIEIAEENLKKVEEMLEAACASTKAPAEAAGDSLPTIGGLSKSIDTILAKINAKIDGKKVKICQDQVKVSYSNGTLKTAVKQAEKENEVALKEQCFDGIAITLAKNQLTAMTRSAMNWVNTGFGGNPFFVQNMTNLVNGIERNVIETGTDILLDKKFGGGNQSPYAENFARSTITGMNLVSSSEKFLGNLTSTLDSFITDPQSYYTNDQLDSAEDTRTALERAQEANDMFANDFSVGGWDGWMALTQMDQNNPLGFTMLANQYLADVQANKVSDTKDELAQNNGFLSQKTCVKWNDDVINTLNDKLEALTAKLKACTDNTDDACGIIELDIDSAKAKIAAFVKECTEYKTITPGSIIRDKTTNYLNSPERQLELAKTINDSLNALFSVLISQLEKGGLSGLSDSATNNTNWTDSTNSFNTVDSSGNSTYDNGGAYNNFNLTRDLGNTYIYNNIIKLGTWNASANTATLANSNYLHKKDDLKTEAENKLIKLYPDTPPEVYQIPTKGNGEVELTNGEYGNLTNPINGYYTISTSGKTKIITAGNNTWEKGDRAFWNGSEWQNWKCKEDSNGKCTNQLNPIKKRGVIQIQNDYIVAGKEILGELDQIMPKLGELDYCLPGPNPSYKINSSNAQSAYQDWVGSMYVGITDNTGSRYGVKIDKTDIDRTYANLKSIYVDNPKGWDKILGPIITGGSPPSYADTLETTKLILSPMNNLIFTFSNICNGKDNHSEENCKGNYTYTGGQPNDAEIVHLDDKTSLMNRVLNYVNNDLFQNFYKTFDAKMNDLYFKKMTNVYTDTEKSIGLIPNDNYIKMAQGGFDLTKDIVYYDDETTKVKKDYTDAITIARVNISKLDPIKNEVSIIIKAAQARRDAKLLIEVRKKPEYDGLTDDKAKAKYLNDYKECFAEENIQFYDADKITAMGSANEENCKDGIDNDMNGLIDKLDPACQCPLGKIGTPPNCVTAPPAIPKNLSATPGSCNTGQVYLYFDTSEGATKYQVYRDNQKIFTDEPGNVLIDTGLESVDANANPRPAAHSYKVQACNDAGCSDLSATSGATVANALACPWYGVYYTVYGTPDSAKKGWISVGNVKMTAWNSKSDPDKKGWSVTAVPKDGFIFDYWMINKLGGANWVKDTWTSYARTDADVGYITKQPYVEAYFKQLVPVSPTLTITPSASCAANGTYSIKLSWTASPGAIGYSVYKKIGTGTPSLKPATIYTTYDDTGLTPGGTYSYMVNAFNSDGGTSTAQLQEITLPACKFTLTYLSNNSAWGVISGNATQLITSGLSGESVSAGANNLYKFVNWSDSQVSQTRKDINITSNRSFTANFVKK